MSPEKLKIVPRILAVLLQQYQSLFSPHNVDWFNQSSGDRQSCDRVKNYRDNRDRYDRYSRYDRHDQTQVEHNCSQDRYEQNYDRVQELCDRNNDRTQELYDRSQVEHSHSQDLYDQNVDHLHDINDWQQNLEDCSDEQDPESSEDDYYSSPIHHMNQNYVSPYRDNRHLYGMDHTKVTPDRHSQVLVQVKGTSQHGRVKSNRHKDARYLEGNSKIMPKKKIYEQSVNKRMNKPIQAVPFKRRKTDNQSYKTCEEDLPLGATASGYSSMNSFVSYLDKIQAAKDRGFSVKEARELVLGNDDIQPPRTMIAEDNVSQTRIEGEGMNEPVLDVMPVDEVSLGGGSEIVLTEQSRPIEKEQVEKSKQEEVSPPVDYAVDDLPYIKYGEVISLIQELCNLSQAEPEEVASFATATTVLAPKRQIRSLPVSLGVRNSAEDFMNKLKALPRLNATEIRKIESRQFPAQPQSISSALPLNKGSFTKDMATVPVSYANIRKGPPVAEAIRVVPKQIKMLEVTARELLVGNVHMDWLIAALQKIVDQQVEQAITERNKEALVRANKAKVLVRSLAFIMGTSNQLTAFSLGVSTLLRRDQLLSKTFDRIPHDEFTAMRNSDILGNNLLDEGAVATAVKKSQELVDRSYEWHKLNMPPQSKHVDFGKPYRATNYQRRPYNPKSKPPSKPVSQRKPKGESRFKQPIKQSTATKPRVFNKKASDGSK